MRGVGLLALLGVADGLLMESLSHTPEGWRRIRLPSSQQRLHLRIAMTAPTPGLLEQKLYEVSNPASSSYGQHLKRDEIREMLRPAPEATSDVVNWLVGSGVAPEAIAEEGEWINFVAPVDIANDLLNTSFAIYKNNHGQEILRTLQYSVPSELHRYIDMVQPTTRFGEVKEQRSLVHDKEVLGKPPGPRLTGLKGSTVDSACNNRTIDPDCLHALYSIPENPDLDNATSGFMAFANYLEQYPRYSDLSEFIQDYFPEAKGSSFSWESINGGKLEQNSTKDSGEANLDAQYLLSSGWPVNMHAYSTAGLGVLVPELDQPTQKDNQNEPFLDWLTYVLAQDDKDLPHTISSSYGENEQSVPLPYRRKVCEMFGQLGARGVSVLFSSGDTGPGSSCVTNDGKNTTRFQPVFPASCPYVTAVGGTTGVQPERAVYLSSGGFSDTWSRPAYQDEAVTAYLSTIGDTFEGLYNTTGRGIPDIAAQGSSFHVIDKGQDTLISGTSASAPVVAGVMALLNAQRLKAGKPTLGFLNPWLYSSGYQGLTDIVDGHSSGCVGLSMFSGLPGAFVPGASWNATKGWDPVTGFGTPNYEKLLPLALACSGNE
ncbi:Tripeptidyl-peptidase SED2 [Pseudocercospora fuligena]|uniref:tripeptidyl-peptidase II n=1 Tax=Pseudocercospora fuligena TaxID=685502 RepID=A0A8H6RE54_9PEZI|nr:Tripeptidyl-peptidase SED2 [Pseudocercospora fuligena]